MTFITRIRAWYGGLPDPVKAALATFFFAFWTIFGLAAAGWLKDLTSWVADFGSNAPDAQPFPDPDVLTKALFAGLTAGAIAVANWIGRAVQRAVSAIPGSGPSYPEIQPPPE